MDNTQYEAPTLEVIGKLHEVTKQGGSAFVDVPQGTPAGTPGGVTGQNSGLS